jgi:LAO/AO transport system kinase
MTLADQVLAGDPRAVARALSIVENDTPDAAELMARVYPRTGRAHLIGLTGAPGAGKSTLADGLVSRFRAQERRVAVLAIDPSSPFSGGAVLGDRVRMQAHAADPGVFIRSMATRGRLGGLAHATADAADVLDAAGFEVVLLETVGVGQAEVDVVRTADVTLVIAAPGAGDDVQALKAGIMEIADIFVINKADREGAERSAAAVEGMLGLRAWPEGAWRPPVMKTVATTGRGLDELVQAIERFREHSGPRLADRRRTRAEPRLRELLAEGLLRHVEERMLAPAEWSDLVDAVAERRIEARAAAASIVGRLSSARNPLTPAPAATFDHVGIAVEDASELSELFQRLFGLDTGVAETVGVHRVRFIDAGDAAIELVEPLSSDSPIARFLASRGSGLHHLCLRVPDIEAALARLASLGVRLVDEAPRPGAHGARIAFVHPASTGGILVELKTT